MQTQQLLSLLQEVKRLLPSTKCSGTLFFWPFAKLRPFFI
ncbi:Hypothetical protein Cp262_0173 [Corynebacterium pseudotuberculosis]|nr:Hypothetical protein Cp262_0173 [Corynebacterium pseudotuberculosis]